MNETLKRLLPAAIVAGAAMGGLVFLVAPGRICRWQKKPFMYRNFAHRGLHKRDKSVPENSIAAFERASAKGYGMELDVQLSRDGEVVVFHDDTLNRVCGVDSRVDEKTYAELKEMSLCGTEETVPLFSEVLKTVRGRGPLIVELKNGRSNKELCEKTYALLKDYNGEYCIESFNPMIVRWFRKNAPEIVRGQLASPPKDYGGEVNGITAFVLGNLLLNFLARPQFIAYKIAPKPFTVKLCEALGAMKVCWTSHDWVNEKSYDVVIFEFYKPKLKYKNK
ncbi:MAG: glycerophosphodiester phosphodiesterase family protein [Bacillota bacterium]|nr:glycerophosphodiester phosphodiesterase family protein [Bacillota bacterium]